MSLTLNMVGGGSGGGISGSDAVLQVTAPINSTVTATDGTSTKTVQSSDSHVSSIDNTVAIYIFSFKSSEFGSWTVTATQGTKNSSGTITIDAAKNYVLTLSYRLYLYNHGDQCLDVVGSWETGGWRYNTSSASSKAPTMTYGSDYVRFSLTNGAGYWRAHNKIDLTKYNTFTIEYGNKGSKTGSAYIYETAVTYMENLVPDAVVDPTPASMTSADISNITGERYLMHWSSWNSGTAAIDYYAWYLDQ